MSRCALAFLAVLLGVTGAAAKGAVLATDANFADVVLGSGKNAFVKFLAPW